MQIKLNLNIFIFILIFIFTRQIEMYGVLMLFALLHELGHILVGILLGLKPKTLTIMPLGLSVGFAASCPNFNKKMKKGNLLAIKKMIIALAGPMTNLLFVIAFLFFDIPFLGIDREQIVFSNILIGLFNCIPIYPLDGGRIVKNICHILFGLENAYHLTNEISRFTIAFLTATASIALLYFKNIAILFILGYLWGLFLIENKKYQNKAQIYRTLKQNMLQEEVCVRN